MRTFYFSNNFQHANKNLRKFAPKTAQPFLTLKFVIFPIEEIYPIINGCNQLTLSLLIANR